jgi:hypothetical protein
MKTTQQSSSDSWLLISLEGFGKQNKARNPNHLIRELVQNSLDAVTDIAGHIDLSITPFKHGICIVCADDGPGINSLDEARTVFFTTKEDDPNARGRFGQGMKELLSLASSASIASRNGTMRFCIERGKHVVKTEHSKTISGTRVEVYIEQWSPSIIPAAKHYFSTFIIPENVTFTVNQKKINCPAVTHTIEAKLATEIFIDNQWKRPIRNTKIDLIKITYETQPLIYEMGIPVCNAEWKAPYHANIRQRVPMNPRRDMIMSGYTVKLHQACLPILIKEMEADDLRQEWVGSVAPDLDENAQKEIISKGWGSNIVRSVPTMGTRRDHDADAREIGKETVDTRHLSEGFREIITNHIPTSAQAVVEFESARVSKATSEAFNVEDAYKKTDDAEMQRKLIEEAGGRERVEAVMGFAQWFSNRLLEIYPGAMCSGVKVAALLSGDTVRFGKPAIATWSGANELTLGLDTAETWDEPLESATLTMLIHEAAHNRSMHHGAEFSHEVEKLAGVAAHLMFFWADHIRRTWPSLLK